MNFPFFNRLVLRKINVESTDGTGEAARLAVEGIARELPDALMAYVAEVSSGRVLASYTSHRSYNPNKVSSRNAKLFMILQEPLATHSWLGGPLLDVSVVTEDQLHHLRPFNNGKWYCFLAVMAADANLGIIKEVTRRYTR